MYMYAGALLDLVVDPAAHFDKWLMHRTVGARRHLRAWQVGETLGRDGKLIAIDQPRRHSIGEMHREALLSYA